MPQYCVSFKFDTIEKLLALKSEKVSTTKQMHYIFLIWFSFVLVTSTTSIDLKIVELKSPDKHTSIQHGHTEGIYDLAMGQTVCCLNTILSF
jgi:hypothetical protein